MFGIVWRETGQMIGEIGDRRPQAGISRRADAGLRHPRGVLGLGYCHRGGQSPVVAYGFRQLGLLLISAYCYPENHASRRILEKCGFHYEGTRPSVNSAMTALYWTTNATPSAPPSGATDRRSVRAFPTLRLKEVFFPMAAPFVDTARITVRAGNGR